MQALSVAENATITCEWFHRFKAEGAFNSCFHLSSYYPTIIGFALVILTNSSYVVGNTA
jgi:hypothetical protein